METLKFFDLSIESIESFNLEKNDLKLKDNKIAFQFNDLLTSVMSMMKPVIEIKSNGDFHISSEITVAGTRSTCTGHWDVILYDEYNSILWSKEFNIWLNSGHYIQNETYHFEELVGLFSEISKAKINLSVWWAIYNG